ncbi:MAG: DUF839 domain-containing protein [Steroidobacteraceae bacterium]|nr:DUF839 domain-containing protein [Steroidobacteraceae bacterium]
MDAETGRRIRDIRELIERESMRAGKEEAPRSDTREHGVRESFDRRSFLRGGAAAISAATIASTLQMSMIRSAEASNSGRRRRRVRCPYGDPVPTLDEVTGLPLIGLPPGFRYWSHGWTGDPIFPDYAGGPVTPALHDGMGVLRQVGSLAILCRNHEVGAGPAFVDGNLQYSPIAPRVAVREHSDARCHVRDHRAVETRAALKRRLQRGVTVPPPQSAAAAHPVQGLRHPTPDRHEVRLSSAESS